MTPEILEEVRFHTTDGSDWVVRMPLEGVASMLEDFDNQYPALLYISYDEGRMLYLQKSQIVAIETRSLA